MLATELILGTPEKFAPSEIKTALMANFPDADVYTTADQTPSLVTNCNQTTWDWLNQWYLFPGQLTTFPDLDQEKAFIVIPFAG
ncbi:hypothetical protein Lepto7375DRAFT_7267 [Leptolyngbya sp. PCC 7375]|nr:hypothetical protein Lepto7375DRAFT_7267 [Leptolyngbya sp. PCC 7375]